MNISDLTKKSIQTIAKNGDAITPILFYDTFCGEARRNRVIVEDCELIKTYIEKLDSEFQKEAKRYNIRNIKEFLSYLTSALNRMNQNHLAKRHYSLLELTKKISEAVSMIDNLKLEELSGRTNAMLERGHSPDNLNEIRREWAKFSLNYKRERNREKLGQYIPINMKDDLDSIIDKVIPLLERENKIKSSSEIVDILFKSATPSLAKARNREFEKLYKELRTDPEKIYEKDTQEQLNKLYEERVDTDRDEEKKSVRKASSIVKNLVDEVKKDIDSKEIAPKEIELTEKVKQIKEDILKISNSTDENSSNLLDSISGGIENIGKQTGSLFGSLKKYSNSIFALKDNIGKLEIEIGNSKKDIDRDLLTKLKNKRGFQSDLEDIEKEYQVHKKNYSVIIIDIDGFKDIVKNYGNDAGDLILRYFSKILKEYISVGDSTSRFGEDRFAVSLQERDLKESAILINRFKEKVKHTKFVYKNRRVLITFSAGIADRKDSDSFQNIIDKANKMMNEAKKLGKDRIFPEI